MRAVSVTDKQTEVYIDLKVAEVVHIRAQNHKLY